MDWSVLVAPKTLFVLSLVALAVPLLFGLRHRILPRMAMRNALRRKRQSAMIAAGLMVGTAIVASAQVAGDSMEYAIVKSTLDAFNLIDEIVYLDGYSFFPQAAATWLEQDPVLRAATDGIGHNIIWDGAVTDERTHLYEPNVRIVGFDPASDDAFGPFTYGSKRFDGKDLPADGIILNTDLAKKLDARVGDTITYNFTKPQDPVLPTIQNVSGRINASVAVPSLPVLGSHVEPVAWEQGFRVEKAAVRVGAAIAWDANGTPRQDLDVEIVDPAGRSYANTNGTPQAPDMPALVVINGSIAHPLPTGDWKLRVHGKAAVEMDFRGAIGVFYGVYDAAQLEKRLREFQAQNPDFEIPDYQGLERQTVSLRVHALTDGGKGPNFQLPNKLSFFVRLDTLQVLLDREGQVNFVKVSNPGGVERGAERTDEVLPVLWERLNESKKADPDNPAIQSLKANNDKQFWLAEAKRIGELFGLFLTFVGSFSIIAGLLLIINIFTMLAEERKTELAMARAVGLKRSHLVQLFTFEGIYYALPAAFLGTILGLGLARFLIWGFNFFGDPDTFPPIPYRLEPLSLVFAFSVGILLTVATVWLGARRASRLNIVSAIRNLEDPPTIRGLRTLIWTALVGAMGLAGTWFALTTESFTWQLLGPTFLAIAAALVLRRFFAKGRVFPLVALALFSYLTAALFVIPEPESREADVIGPIRSVVMTLCLVTALVYTERFARLLAHAAARFRALRAIALPAFSYPLHKKFRTGMTLAMFSVILLVVMLFSIFGALFAPDPGKQSGGYDVEGVSFLSFGTLEGAGTDPKALDDVAYYDVLPFFVRYGADMIDVNGEKTGQFGPPANIVFGIDATFAKRNAFRLLHRDETYASDRAAYEAAATRSDVVIVSYPYSTDHDGRDGVFGPGDTLTIHIRGVDRGFRIIGVQEQYHFPGVFMNGATAKTLFPEMDTLVLFKVHSPEDAPATAKRLEAGYRDLGLDANSIRTKVLEEDATFRQIFTLIQLFLSLGLIVGILSLGIVTARSVIERRQEIGMMRALGYLRRHIRRTFLVETLTVVALGILIGTLVAIIVSFAIWWGQLRELKLDYVIPWPQLGAIALIAFVATTLSTLAPILRAARTPPAEALRYIE